MEKLISSAVHLKIERKSIPLELISVFETAKANFIMDAIVLRSFLVLWSMFWVHKLKINNYPGSKRNFLLSIN